MEFEAILNAVVKSGANAHPLFFALGVFIILKLVDYYIRKIEKTQDKKERIKELFEKEAEREKAGRKREHANKVIQDLLNVTLASLGGDRLQVIEFTNSIETIACLPFKYMTCSYESMALGKAPAADTIRDELTTLYSDFLTQVRLKSFVVLNSEKRSEKFTPAIYHLIGKRVANQSLYIGIEDKKTKEPLGLLSYDISNLTGFCDKDITTLRGLAAQLSVYLTIWEEI